jgi:hypothetical protein
MCPICWATALASFGILFAVSVLAVAATDRWTLALAAALGTLSVLHQTGFTLVPWWLFVAALLALVFRVGQLAIFSRDQLLITRLWTQARHIAATRCPSQKPEQ